MSAHCESHIRAHGPPPIPGLMDTTWKFAQRKNLMLFPVKCAIETGSLQACWAAIEQLFLYSTDQAGILAQSLSQHKGQWLLGRRCGEDQIYLWAFRHFSLKSQDLGQALSLAPTQGSMPSWTSKSSWIDFTWLEIGRQASEKNLLKENGSGHPTWPEAGVSRVCTCQGLAPTSAIAASIKAPDMTESKERQCQKTTTDRLLEMMPPTCQKNDLCC